MELHGRPAAREMDSRQPAFRVRDVPVYGRLVLSPMAGFSDKPFRLICREHGSAMSYTEFVGAGAILNGDFESFKRLEFDPAEQPVSLQIFGHDVELMTRAALRVETLRPAIIDVNMGCSVREVTGRGGGAALLRDPRSIGAIFSALTRVLRVPVTGKIRLGWDDRSRNYREVARVLADSGAALIAVHGRTKEQNYSASADWDAIAEIKQAVAIPVIGNGDVRTVADAERLRAHAGVDAVMVGRAAIGNPWIFAGKDLHEVCFADKAAMVRRHLAAMRAYYGPERGLVLFRKHMAKYISGLRGLQDLYLRLMTTCDAEEFVALVAECERRVGAGQAEPAGGGRRAAAGPAEPALPTVA
jgi:nifR3 family TIM-barrel protein